MLSVIYSFLTIFCYYFADVHTSQDLVAAYFKLLNVNALAKHCLPGYNGYLLSHSTMEDIVKEVGSYTMESHLLNFKTFTVFFIICRFFQYGDPFNQIYYYPIVLTEGMKRCKM